MNVVDWTSAGPKPLVEALKALDKRYPLNRMTAHSNSVQHRDLLLFYASRATTCNGYAAGQALAHCEYAGIPRDELAAIFVLLLQPQRGRSR